MLMGVVDTIMVGRLSDVALASVAIGNAVSISLIFFGIGALFALNTIISQAHGAGDHGSISASLQQGPALALLISLPIKGILWETEPILRALGQQSEVTPIAAAYIRGLVPGVIGHLLYASTRQCLQGVGVVRPILFAVIAGNIVNLGLNWVFIFGNLGAPALGAAGSAYATSMSRWVMLGVLLLVSRGVFAPWWQGFDKRVLAFGDYRRILRIGLPIAVQVCLELWVFTTTAVLMGNLGIVELAGHQIALSVAALSFQVPLSIGLAATTRVGNAIGRQDMPAARRVAALAIIYGTAIMVVSALAFAIFPRRLAAIYTDQPEVITMAATLLPIAALFQLFDGAQAVGSGILRGIADTRIPAIIALTGYWILGLPIGWWLATSVDFGAPGLWYGLTLGLAIVSVLYGARIAVRFRTNIERA